MRTRKLLALVTFLTLLSSFVFIPSSWADDLDATFGADGVVITSLDHFGDSARAVIIDKNQRILVAGVSGNGSNLDFSVARYREDGSLDKSFNFDGLLTTQIGSEDDEAQAIALQTDGKVVVAGYSYNGLDTDFALVRYNEDGSLDMGFGLGGIVSLPMGSGDDAIHTLAVQEDGSILIGGTSGGVAAVLRIASDGSLDTSFGHEGVVFSDGEQESVIYDLLIQEDGGILVSGFSRDEDGRKTLLLRRYLSSGLPDLAFGLAGAADVEPIYTMETAATSITQQENGDILVAGSMGRGRSQDIALFRFSAQGLYDPSFGVKGMVSRDINGEADGVYDIVSVPDGVVVGGYATTNGLKDFVLLRYSFGQEAPQLNANENGTKEGNLHIGEQIVEQRYVDSEVLKRIEATNIPEISVTTTAISSFDDTAYSVAVQEDNKIVLVGSSGDDRLKSFAIARYKSGDEATASVKSSGATSAFIVTTPVTEITRNSAFTGGTILPGSGLSFTSRGVVYSIAPYPLVSGATDPSKPDPQPGTVGPMISNAKPSGQLSAGTTSTILSVSTDVTAECRYKLSASGLTFATMDKMSTTNSVTHKQNVSGLSDGKQYKYSIRCRNNTTLATNQKDFPIEFSVASAGDSKAVSGAKVTQLMTGASLNPETKKLTIPGAVDPVENGKTENGSGIGSYSSIIKELSIGTRYYLRAYAVTSSGTVYYGNQLTFETKDACFIATAAYGSLAHPHVTILREFRDRFLNQFSLGRALIGTYYQYSPSFAKVVDDFPILRPFVRVLLMPFVVGSYIVLNLGPILGVLFAILAGTFLFFGLWCLKSGRKVVL